MTSSTATKTIKVKRMTGETVRVQVEDRPHYAVVLYHDGGPNQDEAYDREIYLKADDGREARRIAELFAEDGEVIDGPVRKLSLGEVAVYTLHGATFHGRDDEATQ